MRTQVDFDLIDLCLNLDCVGIDRVDEVCDGGYHVAEAEGADELGDDRVHALVVQCGAWAVWGVGAGRRGSRKAWGKACGKGGMG